MAVLAVDIGGTNIRTACFDAPDTTGRRDVLRMPHAALGSPVSVDAFARHIQERIAQSTVPIHAIGVSVAAVVDHATGYVKVGENIGWRDVPLGDVLAQACALPVAVDGDAFCGALAEAQLGAGMGQRHFLYVAIGTGIGHAFVLDGRVWHGQHSAANVFGHVKVVPDGAPCYCGGRGCVCQYAAGKGLARLAQIRLRAEAGTNRDGVPDVDNAAGAHANPDGNVARGEDVISGVLANERWAREVVAEATARLAFAISAAYNLLDIECTVIGGGATSDVFPDFAQLHRDLEALVYPSIRPIVLKRAALGLDDMLTGAALLAFARLNPASAQADAQAKA